MSTDPKQQPSAIQKFTANLEKASTAVLVDLVGKERGTQAAAYVALALRSLAKANARIYECDPGSIANAVAMSALTGLMPGGALPPVWIIPRERRRNVNGKWETTYEANWQIGVRGLITLAQRAGYQVMAHVAWEGRPVRLDHHGYVVPPATREEAAPPEQEEGADPLAGLIGVWVTAHRLADGVSMGRFWVPWTAIEKARKRSDAWQRGQKDGAGDRERSSPWYTDTTEMVYKSAIAYAIRRGFVPVDDVWAHALAADAGDTATVIDLPASSVQEAPPTKPKALATSEALDDILGTNRTQQEPERVVAATRAKGKAKPAEQQAPPVEEEPFTDEEKATILAQERREAGDEGDV